MWFKLLSGKKKIKLKTGLLKLHRYFTSHITSTSAITRLSIGQGVLPGLAQQIFTFGSCHHLIKSETTPNKKLAQTFCCKVASDVNSTSFVT